MAREDGIHKIETHVAGLCFLKQENVWHCLIGRRSDARALFPGLWECGGGQVHENERFEQALERQMLEELGIKIKVVFPLGTYAIEEERLLIPGIRFVCVPVDGKAQAKHDGKELVEHAWITVDEMSKHAFIPGVADDLRLGFQVVERLFPGPET